MVGDIVFHLGDCKTGSTSIQHILAHQGWNADGVSVLYPTRLHHNFLARSLTQTGGGKYQRQRFTALRKRLMNSNADHAIISAEHFEFTDPTDLQQALKTYLPEFTDRIRLIAYVRPHADRLISSYGERLKIGEVYNSVDRMHVNFHRKGRLFYTPRFKKWRAIFGARFTLHPMIGNQLHKQDVVEDFFHYLFEGEPFQITGDTTANSSLSVEDLAMMRAIQNHIRVSDKNLTVPQKLLGLRLAPVIAALGRSPGTKPRLHKTLAEDVVRTYRDDAANLDAAFFTGTPMSDALDGAVAKAVDAPQSFEAADHYSPRELQHIQAFADLFRRLMAADPGYFCHAARPFEHWHEPDRISKTPNRRHRTLRTVAKSILSRFRT